MKRKQLLMVVVAIIALFKVTDFINLPLTRVINSAPCLDHLVHSRPDPSLAPDHLNLIMI